MQGLNTIPDIDIEKVDIENLADLKDISVDKNLSKEERIAEYIKQIKNPYCFKCGKFIVKVKFSNNGVSLEDCLRSILV